MSFHELIFYILVGFNLLIGVVGDIKLYSRMLSGRYQKEIDKEGQEYQDMVATMPISEHTWRIINTIITAIGPIIIMIIITAIYFQAKAFNNPALLHTIITYFLIEILDCIYIMTKLPMVYFPQRKITKSTYAWLFGFSVANYGLLILMMVQAVLSRWSNEAPINSL